MTAILPYLYYGGVLFLQAHKAEDEKYAELKADLRQEINTLRDKVLSMIETNANLPDIEKLERQEFILDTDEHQRIQAEEEELIGQVREEIELASLANMFLRDQIKVECWDNMAVKGKVLKVHIYSPCYGNNCRIEYLLN